MPTSSHSRASAKRASATQIVTEEPLELRLSDGGAASTLAVTMRTPGNDFELAAGFLFNEAVVRSRDDIVGMTYCLDSAVDPPQRYNIVTVECRAGAAAADLARFERHFTISSACGVCGRAQLDSLRDLGVTPIDDAVRVAASLLYQLPERMREAQRVFASTGGLHAAALFDEHGEALAVREDVGRHNAVDKIVGWGLLDGRLPFAGCVLVVSGRASYEVLQKSVDGRHPDRRVSLGAEQPRRRSGARVQRNAGGILTRQPCKHLHHAGENCVNDRGFRLDFFIAVAAVLISAVTAAALIYQTRVIGDQFAATIWPYLSVGDTYDVNGETIEVSNDGVGPALVRSAQLSVDGRAVPAWNDYLKVLMRDPTLRGLFLRAQAAVLAGRADNETMRMSSIGAVVDSSTRRIANVVENLVAL